ncbi:MULTISPECIES: trigger factor [Bacillaceae]|jgi:trigger factor|uniref:Trigger factor n=1 Tax=Gottfriedia luciferensis TaxID=178774 RepID=A0ABX2ZTE4_9BACI|nr:MULTISPECIES: trigger factor [Bacillaceae]ODG90333.1 trigger factor [Gottfriedia luciferensis]PGZ93777.1 trigger factor [Bacillus sp. AFS029533]SFD01972.1 trigger factor [Bacillus sp. UNCCL81]
MTAKWEKLEANVGLLTVEVEASEVDKGLDAAFKKVVKTINVPGFRKGKLPRPIFEQKFGIEALYNDALDVILPEAYSKAVVEVGIEPVDRPEVDVEQMEKGKTLIFKAKVTVKPEVKLGEYKGLEVEEMDATVTDEDVQAELTTLQERQAELVVKEDGTVENGNTAVIDFEGFVDGVAFEGGKGENYPLEIGSGSFIPGFEEALIGTKSGVETDVNVTFPEEYHSAELAGKAATFKVTVHEIKAKELPELNDEFAKDVNDEVETLEDLKAKIKNDLVESKKSQAEGSLRDALVQKAAENAEIEIPDVMFESQVDRMVKDFEQRIAQQGLNLELYYQFTGTKEEDLRAQMRQDAEARVRIDLTIDAIIEAEKIDATEEEMNEELTRLSAMYNIPSEQLVTMLGGTDAVRDDIQIRKAVELLVDSRKK